MDNPETYEKGYKLAEDCYFIYVDQMKFRSNDGGVFPPFNELPEISQRAWRLACLHAFDLAQHGAIL
jgi:hypothetical protein